MSDLALLKQMVSWTGKFENSNQPNIPVDCDFIDSQETDLWVERIEIIHNYLKERLKESLYSLWEQKCFDYLGPNSPWVQYATEQWELYWSGVRDHRISDLMVMFDCEHHLTKP